MAKKSDSQRVREKLSKLKPKQRSYVEQRAKGKSKKDAAEDAGYAKSVARNAAENIESSPRVREAFQLLAQKMIKPGEIIRPVKEALTAKYVETAKFEGHITDKESFVDYPTRLKAAELAASFAGYHNQKLQLEGAADVSVTVEYVGA